MPFLNGTDFTDDGRMEIHNEALPYTPAPEDVYINGTLHHGTHGHMIVSGSAFEGATDVFINGYRHTQFGVRYIQIPPAVSPGWVEGFSVETDPAAAGRMPIQGAAAVTSSRGAGRIATGETCVEISVPVVPGNIALEANVFEFAQSFGTDLGNYGIRLTANGRYEFSAEANTGTPFWQGINFGTNWVDDAGASNALFEAQLVLLNGGSVNNPVFTGWSGYDEWLPLTQDLEWLDINDQPATSSNAVIIQVEVREIAVPGNIVTSNYQGGMDNEP
jgi:hypothetical protein